MYLCNHFFFKSTFLQTFLFFLFQFYLYLVLKIFKLELFFEKSIASAIANYSLSFLYTSFIFLLQNFSDVNEHVVKVKACLNH